ncbi:Prenyltransferase family protein, UbiA-like [Desulfonema limicola]|uniref:Prenyltransferase family protein, UbiA-like n=1 Tax=Desulfonema limicola TaxID=45656 RepID=A0A975B8Q6_9BACT|nr:UbiA family prenyltransferase [Desulfonema limicola]QTA80717.1 Prenyltransferase family protein, UbiA-like [Desulfonema limicola]
MKFARLKLFFALSRTPHGLLDMAAPCFGACLWLGAFPSFYVIFIGLITVFAGYTAVYALNDVVDYHVDKKKIQHLPENKAPDLDAALVSHPMARGLLSFKEGLLWAGAWSFIALAGAYILNPVCALFFLGGCVLEAVYCLLLKVSPLRTIINGIVKTLGTLAAVYAVDPEPSLVYLAALFFTLFLWEIGGQNIPNDSTDIEEDTLVGAQTMPVRFGIDIAAYAVLVTLTGAFFLSLIILSLSQADFEFLYYAAAAGAGIFLLIIPAVKFYRSKNPVHAMILFNKASNFPAVMFLIVLFKLVF